MDDDEFEVDYNTDGDEGWTFIAPEEAAMIIREDMTVELLVEDEGEDLVPPNKYLMLAIANKLQSDPDWIKAMCDDLDALTDPESMH